tara:strand:+ start:6319 stop:6942 length:624 start_codon:yes stop_codon:yes gene_type:complete
MANRNFPNDYYAWYNDDSRLAILSKTTTSDTITSRELYDTFQGTGDLSGEITDADCSGTTITFTSTAHGLATNDRVSISGTTSFNDDNLSSQSVTVTDPNTFTMTRSSSSSNTNETGTFTSLFVDNGLRYTYRAKYTAITAQNQDLKTTSGLDSGLHNMVLCYVKARLFEDAGDIERASYYRRMFESGVHKYPLRKSGVRALAVPRI